MIKDRSMKVAKELSPPPTLVAQAMVAYYGLKYVYPVHFEPGEVAILAALEHHLQRACHEMPLAVQYLKHRVVSIVT